MLWGKGTFGLAFIYWLTAEAPRDRRIIQFVWVVSMGLGGLITIITIRLLVTGHLVLPWNIIASHYRSPNFLYSILSCLADKNFWYVFIWLLPLGLVKLRYFPKPLLYACVGSAAIVLILGGLTDAKENLARQLFETIGPLLTISLAYFLFSFKKVTAQ